MLQQVIGTFLQHQHHAPRRRPRPGLTGQVVAPFVGSRYNVYFPLFSILVCYRTEKFSMAAYTLVDVVVDAGPTRNGALSYRGVGASTSTGESSIRSFKGLLAAIAHFT